ARASFEGSFNKIEPAIADCTEAIRLRGTKRFAGDAGLYAGRANLYLAHAETDRALADYDESLRLDPKSAWVHYCRGYARTRKGEWDRAIADFDEGKRLAGDDKNLAGACVQGRGDCLALAGRIDEARTAFEECLRLAPGRAHPVLATTAWFIDQPRGDY